MRLVEAALGGVAAGGSASQGLALATGPRAAVRHVRGRLSTRDADPMPVHVGPRPLPQVVLSRDFGANAIREAQASGLLRVCHGAFVEPLVDADTWKVAEHLARARISAVAHRLTNSAVFSHESAAAIHGLWLLRTPEQAHVTQRRKPRQQTSWLRRHTGSLPTEQVVEVNGLRVTSIERTIVDCAKAMHPRDALVVADSGMRLILQPRRDQRQSVTERTATLRALLLEVVETGARRGRRQARAVIAHADPCSESPYETVVRWIAVSRGLPPPVLQARFEVRGNTYYADMCWYFELTVDGTPFRLWLIGEYDGELKYVGDIEDLAASAQAASDAIVAEKWREDDLRSRPDTQVLRFDRRDANEPEETFRRLCAALPASYVATLRLVPELAGLAAPRRRSRP